MRRLIMMGIGVVIGVSRAAEEDSCTKVEPPSPPPSWPLKFSASFFATGREPRGSLSLPLKYKGRLSYDNEARKQRLEHTALIHDEEETPRTLVELWRGHEEIYVFSPTDKSCQLVDWSFGALEPGWCEGSDYGGPAYDVQRTENGSSTLVMTDTWIKPTTIDIPVVAHFLKAERPVPVRVMGPSSNTTVTAWFFSSFSQEPPTEDLFVVPSYCKNMTAEVQGETTHKQIVTDPQDLQSFFLSSKILGVSPSDRGQHMDEL